MKSISSKILAFIASLVVGFLIVINMKLGTLPVSKQLSAKEYKDAIDERNKLFKELETLRNEKYATKEKINSYTHDEGKDEKIVEDMLSQLNDYGMVTGLSAVKGPGVVIKIEDGDYNTREETEWEYLSKILHNTDAAMILNEIRLAGAEAIALKNHRIISSTAIQCDGPFLKLEDYSQEYAPFYFYVIGDPEQLNLKLTQEGSFLNKLILRKLKVEIEVKDEIVIPASEKNFTPSFMRQSEVK